MTDDCYHYAQNICQSQQCFDKHAPQCSSGLLSPCEAHAVKECRPLSTQDSANPSQGTPAYTQCLAKTTAECNTHGAI